ncbi:MAG: hypothetical protein HOQ27_15430 [Dermatophilaceae bacterium]|nr:hypothetical protein [Dermatophilaceae bacterium]NUR79977.1 hypothetical protein [Dermatophilaceae bacterium]
MAATAEKKNTLPALHHETFCQPTGERDEVRVEQYVAYRDDPATARSVAAKRATRCLECGATTFEDL